MQMAGIGVDIVQIERVRAALERTPRFRERVFTREERAYCDRRANPYASYAGCFAAREAVLKALGCGFGDGVGWCDVSVTHDDRGRPQVLLAGKAARVAEEQGVTDLYLSISHTNDVAVANAVAATGEVRPTRPAPARRDEAALLAARFKEARGFLDELDQGKGDQR
jgi:holo-[acyl-carrier protein] synthase